MIAVVLHGSLNKRFGGPFNFSVGTPQQAIRAMCHQLKGFQQMVMAGSFQMIKKVNGKEVFLRLEALTQQLQDEQELHIVPVVAGSKGGSSKAIIGVAIIAAAFTFGAGAFIAAGDGALTATAMSAEAFSVAGFSVSWAQIAGFGAAMLFGGIAQMLSPTPAGPQASNSSYIFNGAANTSAQGVPVPLCFGRFICGSIVPIADIQSQLLMGDVEIS